MGWRREPRVAHNNALQLTRGENGRRSQLISGYSMDETGGRQMNPDESDLCGCRGRLAQLECPGCQATRWTLESDNVGPAIGGTPWPYPRREYSCSACGRSGRGWAVRQQSPKAFLLQPDPLHPMTAEDFDYWVSVLRANFP
jgi:hypothetical protein